MDGKKLGIVIIAAGNSSRLGTTKQLVRFKGTTLLQRAVDLATSLSKKTVCVLGYQADRVRLGSNINEATCIVNTNWHLGMGSSIAVGCEYLCDQTDAILIMLCDQYQLQAQDVEQLLQSCQQHPNKIIASEYFEEKYGKMIVGAPAIFPKQYYHQLKQLTKTGARKILEKNIKNRIAIPLKNAAADLDTQEDLDTLLEINHD